MFGHLPELIIILIIALIVFGPERLPEVAANAGRMLREVREAMNETLNQEDVDVSDDFSAYYYDSLARSGEGEDVEILDAEEGASGPDLEDADVEEPELPVGEPQVQPTDVASHPEG